MDNYNFAAKNEYFDGDVEKGEVNVMTKMRELECVSDDIDGLGSGNVLNNHEEKAISFVGSSSDDDLECVRLIVVDKNVVDERKNGDCNKEKVKVMSAKKPPRPPRGLSLDSSDQKLIRELHELARLKRARVERMKALKKGKEAKAASSKNQLFATLLTILFCLVLLLQGISSRTSTSTSVREPPFSSAVLEQHNTLSLRHYPVSSETNHNKPGFKSPRLVKQVAGLDITEQVRRAVG